MRRDGRGASQTLLAFPLKLDFPTANAPASAISEDKTMKKIGLALSLICTALFLAPTVAQAQATRTWVSGVGDDVNPCSRTAPCKTFPGAISKTAAGGEIDTLDPGSFATVTIVKAITIASEGSGEAGILTSGTNGVTVNCTTDPNCVVILRGLEIDGGPTGSNSLAGVKFIAGKALFVQNCQIRNFTGPSPNGYGISFTPSTGGGTAALYVQNTNLVQNGTGSTGGGIFVQPTGTPLVTVSVENSQASNNGFGIRTDSSQMSGGSIQLAVSDSETDGNASAGVAVIGAMTGGIANVGVIARTTMAHNGVGVNANGAMASLHIGASMLFDNTLGVKLANSGTADSFGGNQFYNNPTGPGPTLTIVGPF
jgi:nitrous oxidase accessory protein NosD